MVLSMDRWKGKVAVVTGASGGIGAAITEQLVAAGLQVAGLDKRTERFEELSKKLQGQPGKLHPIKADITKEQDILQAFKWVLDNLGPVHILVNNAGVAANSTLVDGDTENWRTILDTNVIGLCISTREAVKVMRANNIDGHIVHINSETGHYVPHVPGLSVYPASKYAVTALTETLRQEFNQIGSKIKSVSPGAVDTNIVQNSGMILTPELEKIMKTGPLLQPKDIADAVLYVLSTPPHVQVHELTVKPTGTLVA